jgi:hypothetical protein
MISQRWVNRWPASIASGKTRSNIGCERQGFLKLNQSLPSLYQFHSPTLLLRRQLNIALGCRHLPMASQFRDHLDPD